MVKRLISVAPYLNSIAMPESAYAMMAAQQSRPDPVAIAQQNAAMRATLLATAPRMRKNVITAVAGTGQTTRLKLFNVGVVTKLQIKVQADITIGVAIATASPKAPYNLISRIRLTDYDGTDRINLSGFQLWVLNSVRWRQPYGVNNSSGQANVFTNPVVPTAVGNGSLKFYLDVPLAFDVDNPIVQLQDLRGSILAQTAVGEMYLSIDWTNSLYANGDCDSVYNGAGTTTVVGQSANYITVQMWQEYLLPQSIGGNGGIPLPAVDLSTVYELTGNLRSSDNLAANAEKLVSYPNVRSVIGAYVNYITNGIMANGNISQVRLIANGNNTLLDYSNETLLLKQRNILDGDLVPSAFFVLHREKPIETALFGNVQLGVTPANVNGGSQYVEIGWESFYTKGQALPGLSQAQ
jgi:hypothetical protein